MLYIFSSFISLLISSVQCTSTSDTTRQIPTSCLGLDDGYHYLKLLPDDEMNSYPIIYALCHNEYVVIDHSIDGDWSSYLSSFTKYHYAVVGPIRNDHSNWSKWFLPELNQHTNTDTLDTETTINHYGNFLVSPQCDACLASDDDESIDYQLHGDQSAYYMSALAFGCFNAVRGWPACDMDFDSYECKICTWDTSLTQISSTPRPSTVTWEDAVNDNLKTGICDFEIRNSRESVSQSFSKCAAEGDSNSNWKPSLGIDGRYCQCWKPSAKSLNPNEVNNQRFLSISTQILHEKIASIQSLQSLSKLIVEEVEPLEVMDIHLYQSDFESGTYRITAPGTYVVMEDIEFDFNAPPGGYHGTKSPNDVRKRYWWPLVEDKEKYPGAGSARDPYFLGFFAGITIECDDVILDLNNHELRMSRPFYYQQPYFSIIELASQPFLPQQGPGFFGADPRFASNVLIKDGTLGLSSHHGIHGNNNREIRIENVVVHNFQTHGIQINGFDGVNILDTEIGPSSERAYLNGNYGHMRLLLPTMMKIADEHPEDTISFNGRKDERVTMYDLIDKVVTMMDLVLDYVIDGTVREHHDYWDEAVKMFVNPSGLPFGAVLYGLYLNYPSAGIFGWHVNDQTSTTATLENVHIHSLRHKGIEVVGLNEGGRVICNGFNGPLPAKDILGHAEIEAFQQKLYAETEDDTVYPQYIGSAVTDIHIAMYYWGREDFDNWAGIPFFGFGDKMVEWARGHFPEYISSNDRTQFGFYCNEDAMFHPAKGLLALKISGVEGVEMNNVKIENLQDETPLGSNLCGVIDQPQHGQYHFAQQLPYQVGFSMNMVMGITIDFSDVQMSDTHIEGLYSHTGLVYGMAGWFESNINVDGDLKIHALNAGVDVEDETYDYMDLPNKAPEACAVRLFEADDYPLTMEWSEDLMSSQSCIRGAVGCLGDGDSFTHLERILSEEEVSCSPLEVPFKMAPMTFEELLHSETSLIPKPPPPDSPPPPSDEGMDKENEEGAVVLGGSSRIDWFRKHFERLFPRKKTAQNKLKSSNANTNLNLDFAFIDNFVIGLIVITLFIIGLFSVKMVYLSRKRRAKAALRNALRQRSGHFGGHFNRNLSEMSPLIQSISR